MGSVCGDFDEKNVNSSVVCRRKLTNELDCSNQKC